MRGQAGFFDVDERLKELSAKGDDLERLAGVVNFELFRSDLARAVPRSNGSKGGRPPFDHVFMWKVLILQAVGRANRVPDQGPALVHALPRARAVRRGAGREYDLDVPRGVDPDDARRPAGDPGLVPSLRGSPEGGRVPGHGRADHRRLDQRNTEGEKADIRAGRIPEAWRDKPAKLAQKDRDARWTVKWSKAKPAADGSPRVDLAVPAFGYKNHVGIDRRHGLIRTWAATDAARHDGAQLANLVTRANTGSGVWADTAYRSKANEQHLAQRGFVSHIHRKKPPGRPMPRNVARANGAKSKVRSAVEHVFAGQKGPMGLIVRTVGLARAAVKIGLANLVYNMRRAVWLTRQQFMPA